MCVNPKSHLVEMTRLMEIPQLFLWKLSFTSAFYMQISCVAMHVHRNEVIIEW